MYRLIFYILLGIYSVISYDQNEYGIYYERLEVAYYNNKIVRNLKSHNFKYNRTSVGSNLSGTNLVDFGNSLQIEIQAYKWASNEYRLFPITFSVNFCSAASKNDFGLGNLYKCGNFSKCPMVKGKYIICNFSTDETKFPPFIPAGSYRIDMKFFLFSAEVQHLQGFGTVKWPIPLPR